MILVHSANTIGYPTKLNGEKYKLECRIEPYQSERLKIKFGYNKYLLGEIKAMAGARWEPEGKFWHILDNSRNWFQLAYLSGYDPYEWYDRPPLDFKSQRPLYPHQFDLVRHGITYHYGIWAAEMGTGKSLAAIEVLEYFNDPNCLYVGPKSALASFQLELQTWECKITPKCVTYDGLKKLVGQWQGGVKAPRIVILDESSRIKTPTSQRSQAAFHLAEAVRRDWGDQGVVILMSGSPAPKSPADWFWQAEVAMPGFIKEGTIEKFKSRLGLIVTKESLTGGSYPHLVTWRDDEKKCNTCGLLESDYHHDLSLCMDGAAGFHPFCKSVNEVSFLYERMKGLVEVKFKKDCLKSLPDKRYREIFCEPRQATLNAAKIIAANAATTISGLTLLRELSDGFQYQDNPIGAKTCDICKGNHMVEQPVPIIDQEELNKALEALMERAESDLGIKLYDETGVPIPEYLLLPDKYEMQLMPCWHCNGEGTVIEYAREAIQVPCPKEDALKDIIDSHDEDGRLVTYAGFTGSLDRVIQIHESMGWDWIRVDGQGWKASKRLGPKSPIEYLRIYQKGQGDFPHLGFIGHPGSAGMGLTLTASCEIVYYSNDFNAESRIQSEDRIHRLSMDLNKGALITDLLHLPSDKLVLDNLKKKRKLQDLSLGQFSDALKNAAVERRF